MLRVIDIKEGTTVDGPGLRTSIYFSGCNHKCEGCHNPESWDINAGNETSIEDLIKVIDYNNFDVTFSGGDPFFQAEGVTELAREIKKNNRNIWCFTGYKWEAVVNNQRFRPLLETIDVLVDSPFILAQRDISLLFRGSANQRIIDVPESLKKGEIVLYKF
ncbi:MAG: anaerobic ribonucleoside-triphosphate reductase activating protein [Bacteroidaceae bacterium]|nr:anaerobic ribonucleoside-triphosphate reductase activating protein [Bacteroidaceae bacterium]